MEDQELLDELKALGEPRAITVWKRMGMPTEKYWGVGLTKIRALGKKVKRDHDLALRLWDTGIHDARLLATFVAEPKKTTSDLLDTWVGESDFFDISDKVCTNIAIKTSFATDKTRLWRKDEREFVRRSGYLLLSEIVQLPQDLLTDEELHEALTTIEQKVGEEANWVREAMNYALISLGSRNLALNAEAVRVAQRLGPIPVDYGESSCKAPDALTLLTREDLQARLVSA